MAEHQRSQLVLQLRSRVTCPHCWHTFPPDSILWISAHEDLRGDPVAGDDEQQRFLPTHFSVSGHAIDARGEICRHLACPRCHLSVARSLLEMRPLLISILGSPSSGKSYFLASMVWQLRNTLQESFGLDFHDSDTLANDILTRYLQMLFHSDREDDLVALPKTEQEGELYQSVFISGRQVWYPRPFVFAVQPTESHPGFAKRQIYSRALCLYDNAGEHFLPGHESSSSPGTQHLAHSEALLFMFDPMQHPQLRRACRQVTKDPQARMADMVHHQDQILREAANRIRDFTGLAQTEKYTRPLIVVVTKFDAWCRLSGLKTLSTSHVVRPVREGLCALDLDALHRVSNHVRSLLKKYARDIVAAAEGFASHVLYIPVSAQGCSPELDRSTGALAVRPRDIKPMWAELPLLYALNQVAPGIVRAGQRAARARRTGGQGPSPRLDAAPPSPPSDAPSPPQSGKASPPQPDEAQEPRIWRETGS